MLKLAPSAEPHWLDILPGVRVRFRPITVTTMLVARDAVGKVLRAEDQEDIDARADIALTRELAHRGIIEWDGVGDADGNVLPVGPESVDALLEVWQAYDAINRLYVGPALERETEKNGFASGQSGTSAEAPNTAAPAA